ncbi:type II and III secretion system protein family protein [Rhodovibrionaceae bacterium A322]
MQVFLRAGELISLPRPAASIFVADPDVADFQAPSSRSIFVIGKHPGVTTLYALDSEDKVILRRRVLVSHDTESLTRMVRRQLPNSNVAFSSTPSGLVASGGVRNSTQAQQVMALASSFLAPEEKVINRLAVTAPTQVNIRIRVAEISRAVSRQLGFNWNAALNIGNWSLGLASGRAITDVGGGLITLPNASGITSSTGSIGAGFESNSASVNAILDALAEEGLVSVLAEPNLTAVSGENASFFAGGEFPVPVAATQDRITIEFKKFGVLLDLVPTVLSPGRISLKVRPEVSNLSESSGVVLESVAVPGLEVRRAETTIELGSGQSFALAGLLQDTSNSAISKFPGLGDLSVLGPLFRSTSFQRNETELVIIATAYVVEPGNPSDYGTPLDGFRPATDLERILEGRLTAQTVPPGQDVDETVTSKPRLIGPAGFYY